MPRRAGAKRKGIRETCENSAGRTYYRGRIWLRDGTLTRITIDEPACYSKGDARREIAKAQADEDKNGTIYTAKTEATAKHEATIAGAAGETCDAWYRRFHTYEVELGHTDAKKKQTRWTKWISPRIGARPIASITRDDIENIRDDLDRAIAEWNRLGKSAGKLGRAISGKTTMNVWSALTSSFKAATSSKRRDLRVLDGRLNPCLGVEPPGDRVSRQPRRKTFLYPKEAAAILACEAIPLDWREVYAVALFLYLRPGELRVLTWEDVSIDEGHVHVTKAWDYQDEKIKPPKTRNGVRYVPIDDELVPLLRRMRDGQEVTSLVVPRLSAFGEDHLAEQFRRHLKASGLDRAELHKSTRTHVQANFRSCRDSGLTWLAMSGLGVDKIMRRAGHDEIDTTMGYVTLAEDLSGGTLGTPFAPLPPKLVAGRDDPPSDPLRLVTANTAAIMGAGGGSRNRAGTSIPAENRESASLNLPREERPSTRSDVERRKVDHQVDHHRAALERELARARAERRWVDADAIEGEIGQLASVVDLDAEARRRGRR